MDNTIYHSMHGMLRNQQIKEVLHVSMEQAKLCPNAAWHKDNDGNSYTKKVKNLVSGEKKVADWLNIPALKWLDICCGSCVIVFLFYQWEPRVPCRNVFYGSGGSRRPHGAWCEVNDKHVPLAWWYDIPSWVTTVLLCPSYSSDCELLSLGPPAV